MLINMKELMQIHKYTDIKYIKVIWEKIYIENELLTPFQSYEWNLLLQQKTTHPLNRLLFNLDCKRNIEYQVFSVNNYTLIAPLTIDYKNKMICILGQDDMSDYLSFIFSQNVSVSFILKCIKKLQYIYRGFQFKFDRIKNDSVFSTCLLKEKASKVLLKKCVAVDLCENRLDKLSKNTRQNIRTAENRIKNAQFEVNYDYFFQKLDFDTANKLFSLYQERHMKKDPSITLSNKMQKYVINKIKKIFGINKDILSEFLTNNNNSFVSLISINKTYAAFFAGMVGQNGTIYICRAATNIRYLWYSPGDLLLKYTIQNLLEKSNYKLLDLTRGDESYKLRFGGDIHYNLCIELPIINI